MEGQVYLCGWEQTENGFRLWLRANPRIQGRGKTVAAAERLLWSAVEKRYGDGEPLFEFAPHLPRPGDAPTVASAEWMTLAGRVEEGAYASDRTIPVTTELVCPVCEVSRGRRTAVGLGVESFPNQRCNAITLTCDRFSMPAFSEEFLALLTDRERAVFEWRPVSSWRKSKRKFFEMVSPTTIQPVAKAGVQFWTWQCPECRGMANVLWSPGYLNLPRFVSEADLPSDRGAFAFGYHGASELCLPARRWQELVKQPSAKGVFGVPVAVLPPEQVAAPEVFPLPEFDRLCELQTKEWKRLRDEWLKSPEVLVMQENSEVTEDEVLDFIHARVDEQIGLPRLHRSHSTLE